ncbi:MAG: hypothetical protein JSS83_21620 [Cyanobacteria bacterium SZAS LIN-3]|nr:hypothetical protein [Cyanobacteria bacterium SZAS LIN-3]
MQGDWGNDNDWQLKKLQHDSLKTAEKVVETLRETIEREVLAQGKEYERRFGPRSAQFTEYLTMVAQKLEQHGITHPEVINWLNSAATEGAVPRDYASDLRDSQSRTVPFIDGGPMHDFGEQSLMDRSLGNQGASSQRPQAFAPAAPSPLPAQGMTTFEFEKAPTNGNGHTNGQGNGHGTPSQGVPIPQHTPVSMPLQQMMPSTRPQPNLNQTAVVQPGPQPSSFPAPTGHTAAFAPAPPPVPVPVPAPHATPIPASIQAQLPPSMTGGRPPQPPAPAPQPKHDEKPEEEKYVFDPFTAWD